MISAPYDLSVAARIEEFWHWFTPWQRRLWNVGSLSAISELLETAESQSGPALAALQGEVLRLTGPDPAIGDQGVKKSLTTLLGRPFSYRSDEWRKLEQLLERMEHGYLGRWANLAQQSTKPGPERIARAVAGHLLRRGYSSTYLYRWIQFRKDYSAAEITLTDLLDEAEHDLG